MSSEQPQSQQSSQKPAPSIAERIKAFLQWAWDRPQEKPEDVWFYTKALGTKFVEFVGFSEKMLKTIAGRLRRLEDAAVKAGWDLGDAPQEQQAPPAAAEAPTGAPPAPTAGAPRGNSPMVRVDALGRPMTPEEQKAAEAADIQFDGQIDRSQYMPLELAEKRAAQLQKMADDAAAQARSVQEQSQPQPPNGAPPQS